MRLPVRVSTAALAAVLGLACARQEVDLAGPPRTRARESRLDVIDDEAIQRLKGKRGACSPRP